MPAEYTALVIQEGVIGVGVLAERLNELPNAHVTCVSTRGAGFNLLQEAKTMFEFDEVYINGIPWNMSDALVLLSPHAKAT